jgi:hypothetical protein
VPNHDRRVGVEGGPLMAATGRSTKLDNLTRTRRRAWSIRASRCIRGTWLTASLAWPISLDANLTNGPIYIDVQVPRNVFRTRAFGRPTSHRSRMSGMRANRTDVRRSCARAHRPLSELQPAESGTEAVRRTARSPHLTRPRPSRRTQFRPECRAIDFGIHKQKVRGTCLRRVRLLQELQRGARGLGDH